MLMPSIFGENLFDDFFGDFPFYYDDRAMKDADTSVMSMDTEFFSTFLSQALSLVVGVEFVKMLCQHSAQTVVEVLMFATARQMVVEHLGPAETLLGVLSIAVLFAIRKYLMTDNDDMNAHNCPKNTEEN